MLKIEVIKFEAQDVITASVAAPKCVCDPLDCYLGETTTAEPIVIHSNNCTATTHICDVKMPE